jgi:hypothetical protein
MSNAFNWNKVLGDEDKKESVKDGASALTANPTQDEANEILKNFEDQDDKLGHYKPIHVNQDVHSIQLDNGRFNHEDQSNEAPLQIEADAQPIAGAHIDDILRMAIERKASDIHLTVGLPPMVRLDGELAPLPFTVLTAQDTRRLIYDTYTDEQVQKFEQTHELDFAYSVKGLARFRFNAYIQRGSVTGALRVIPTMSNWACRQ